MRIATFATFIVLVLTTSARATEALVFETSIRLPGVKGRIDHLAFDANQKRLYVAALGNNTVEVVDTSNRQRLKSLTGFSEPQGVLVVPESGRLYVANGSDGTVRVWDTTALKELARIPVGDDADNLRYDAAAKRVYVGFGNGALGEIDPKSKQLIGQIALKAHPESFQIEKGGQRIFVNTPGSHGIAIVNRSAKAEVNSLDLGFAAANFPLALDEEHHRVFVGCRLPPRLLIFDTETSKSVEKLDLNGDCDDIFYDQQRQRIYASCGEGYVDVFQRDDAEHYRRIAEIKTAPKARTSLWVGDRLFLAVPASGAQEAHIAVYSLGR
ncbi:MAG TPA: YncE family protein [Opitutaceae bacterium]|nr:YncE family protein [Opitutaceae bacterium]